MSNVINLIITSMFIYNAVVYFGCGSCGITAIKERMLVTLKIGLLTTIGIIIMTLFSSVIKVPSDFRAIVSVIITLLIWTFMNWVCTKISFMEDVLKYYGICLMDSAMIIVYLQNARNNYNITDSLIIGAAAGIGFTIVTLIMGSLVEKFERSSIPKAFKGLPLMMIAYGIMAMACNFFVIGG